MENETNKPLKITLAYDGTPFFGFQKNRDLPTIELLLQNAFENVLQHKIEIQGSSRTDRGVHAEGQVAHFFLKKPFCVNSLKLAANSHLPKEIRILTIEPTDSSFHPTLSVKSKTYKYLIDNGAVRSTFLVKQAWYIHSPLDIELMQEASILLTGDHDYRSFAKHGHHQETFRTIEAITIEKTSHLITIRIRGKSFLYRMVRAIVGTLAYVGLKKISPLECFRILEACDRRSAGPSAPAHGLYLESIAY